MTSTCDVEQVKKALLEDFLHSKCEDWAICFDPHLARNGKFQAYCNHERHNTWYGEVSVNGIDIWSGSTDNKKDPMRLKINAIFDGIVCAALLA